MRASFRKRRNDALPVKGTPLQVPPCLFFISGCSPFKVASGRALASAVRNTYCGQGFSAHQGRQSSAYARSIRARHWAPRVSAGYPECFESISKKASPFPAKAGNRDSIRSKVFEGGGPGEETFSRKFPPPVFLPTSRQAGASTNEGRDTTRRRSPSVKPARQASRAGTPHG